MTPDDTHEEPRIAGRRFWLVALASIGTYLLLELCAWILIPLAVGSFDDIARDRRGKLHGGTGQAETLVPHPFVGFVLEPGSRYFGYDVTINEHGFPGSILLGDETNDTVVAIAGGSFAMRFWIDSHELLERLLTERLQRPVRTVCLAVSAHRQPQQLFSALYYLTLGGRIDALINIDGFNEAVNNESENPLYPWGWAARIGAGRDEMILIGTIASLRQSVARAAEIAEALPSTPMVNLVWKAWDNHLQKSIVERNLQLAAHEREYRFYRDGPRIETDDQQRYAARLWSHTSILLKRLADAHHFSYLHVLQPNQYLPGTKRYSEQETREFLLWENRPLPPDQAARIRLRTYAEEVRRGYKILQDEARRLPESGVAYHDFTRVYSDQPETLYIDSCCHVSREGNDIFARKVAALIDLSRVRPKPPSK